jgi:AcrR family transcriptional regulator
LSRVRISKVYDARARRSREALREALLRLVEQKPFDQIQIKEITTEAGVSYPVFFRQFTKKEDILNDIAEKEVQHLLAFSITWFDSTSRAESIAAMCQYVQDHRVLWTRLLTSGAADVMRAEFARISSEISAERGRASPALPQDLVTNLVIGGIFEVLSWWLRQPQDYPMKKIVWLLRALVIDPVYRAHDFDDLEQP